MDSEAKKTWQTKIFVIYLLGFLFTLHTTLPAYINSTFLRQITSENFVGLIYTVAAIITIIAFAVIPKVLKRFGNYRTVMTLLAIDFFSLLGLVFNENHYLIFLLFITGFVAIALIGFNIDVFLESLTSDSKTGKIRGTLLSTSNIAWIISPLITGFILTDGDYWKIFLAAALLLIPVLFLVQKNLSHFKDAEYRVTPPMRTFRDIVHEKNIRGAFMVSFFLQFFYSWMIIYTPIYLYTYIGFTWQEIGTIFSVMLLPFVLTEAPLGRLADTRWGEKEVMCIGFIVMALSTGMITFIETKSLWLWMSLLFISRVGASMVEIMSETYFFKKVNSDKANIIGMFRTMRPWAYILSPILATILFAFALPIKYIFIVLAIIMFLGLYWSLELEDTR